MHTFCLILLSLLADTLPENVTTGMPAVAIFELIELPYAVDALEPAISSETMMLHHGKHLRGYVDNLNRLTQGTRYATMPLEMIVAEADGPLFNNAGQTLNHNLYFTQFSPTGGGAPTGALAEAINATWGSFEQFKQAFAQAGTTLFGSGWVWLAQDNEGKLYILQEHNGGNPVTRGLHPLLGFDLWEHAYYLDYHNRRADHLDALWNIVDWIAVAERYTPHPQK